MLAEAADPLGLYVGAAVGQATIRADPLPDGVASISKNDTGWKIMLGVRPIPLIGAELEYIDFGHAHTQEGSLGRGFAYRADLRATGPSAFGILYAPIPVPAFDLYGKVGMSRLHSTVNEVYSWPIDCFPGMCPAYLRGERTDTRLAYGAGLQVKLARLAVRAEYERISASTGDPSLMSLGLIWTFY
jgi:opacity protein-like surface antigen